MNDQEIKKLLTSYVREEMALIQEKELPGYDHDYSKSYVKRIRRMFWSEKYFGSKLYFGYAVRNIAIVAIIIISLFVANEVSAQILGFNPWKTITTFLSASKMEITTYQESVGQSEDANGDSISVIQKDIPTRVPVDFKQKVYEPDASGLYVEWCKDNIEYLQYTREKLSDDTKIAMDGEYESKQKIEVAGFDGEIYVKDDEMWLYWDDMSFHHMIIATGIKNPKDIIRAMAESLYI